MAVAAMVVMSTAMAAGTLLARHHHRPLAHPLESTNAQFSKTHLIALVKVQRAHLDTDYLSRIAIAAGLEELLARLLEEGGPLTS